MEFTLNPNSMIEIAPEFCHQGHCSSPMYIMLAFLCKNFKSLNQSIYNYYVLLYSAPMPYLIGIHSSLMNVSKF